MKFSVEPDAAARTLYLLVYPSPLFAAHWSLFVPTATATRSNNGGLDHGLRIHVTGDRLNGFVFEVQADYSIKDDGRHPIHRVIGLIPAQHLHQGNEAKTNGTTLFQLACSKIPPPGASLSRVGQSGPVRPKKEVRDCQWWVYQVISALTKAEVIVPLAGVDPIKAVEQAPKH